LSTGVPIRVDASSEGETNVLTVHGWLTHADVGELLRCVDERDSEPVIDLAELRTADRAGLEALRSLKRRSIKLRRAPPHLALQLEDPEDKEGDGRSGGGRTSGGTGG
jgi:hypothetical protein